jgi:hypothetical protein
MKKIAIIILLTTSLKILSQTTVFEDDFETNQNPTFTTSGQIGNSSWYVNRSGDDWGARIFNGRLELTNDATPNNNNNGWVFSYVNTNNFGGSFNTILNQNYQRINYIFNLRQSRTDPTGFGNYNSYGVAFIIGADVDNNLRTTGKGYAIVLGQPGSPNPIRFVKFSNGLQSASNLIVATVSGLDDVGNKYLSLALSYEPSENKWTFYGRNDGQSSFGNPADGNLTSLGSVVDNEHTGVSLNYLGAYWQGSTGANQTAYFDNVKVVLGNIQLPVELKNFNFKIAKKDIILTWETAVEVNNYGFEIERKYNGIDDRDVYEWKTIGFIKGNGNSNTPRSYFYIDKNLSLGYYYYRLKQIDNDGKYNYSEVLKAKIDVKPEKLDLANYPNPFNPNTKIYFELPEDGITVLKIYDILGNEVRTLVNEFKNAGTYEINFDGNNLSAGVYFNVLRAGDKTIVKKMQLIK